jgi:hypothetical protein
MTEGTLVPVSLDLSPDLRVLALTLSVAALTGILFGLAQSTRNGPRPMETLASYSLSAEGDHGVDSGRHGEANAEEGSSYPINDRILAHLFRLYDVISPYIGVRIGRHSPGLSLNHLK